MKKVVGALALAAGLLGPGAVSAAFIQTIDTYEMLGGPFTGEVLSLETRYPVPELDLPYLQIGPSSNCDGFYMSVSFLDVFSSNCEDGLLVNYFPQDYSTLEVYSEFQFDPALNAHGLAAISMNPSGGIYFFDEPQGPDNVALFVFGNFTEYRVFDGLGFKKAEVPAAFIRQAAVVPLPLPLLTLGTALVALAGLRRRVSARG